MKLTQTDLKRIEYEILRYPEEVQNHYYDMVASGQNPRFALMCACQQAPGTRYSDKTFNAERRQAMTEMKPKMRDRYLKMAKQAGISTQGRYYVGSLGRPTDPSAWVSTVDDAKRTCERKNLTAEGIVKHNGHEVEPKKPALSPDITDRLLRRKLARNPALAAKCRANKSELNRVRAEVVARHGRPNKR